MKKRTPQNSSARRKLTEKEANLSREANKQGLNFLRLEIDLSFTFVAVALSSYASGSLEHARQAANDARKGYHGAQDLLLMANVSASERRRTLERLKRLEEVFARIESKDPGVFERSSSLEMARK